MIRLAYFLTALLVFFPAVGFLFLKSASEETRCSLIVRRTLFFLFLLQIAGFCSATALFLSSGKEYSDRIILFSFFALYGFDLVAVMLICRLPEPYQSDPVVARLLQTYIILFIILFLAGALMGPFLGSLSL